MRAALALLMAIHAAPLAAQTVTLPAGCEGVATVQLSICTVVNIWRCGSGGATEIWAHSQAAASGVVYQRDADGNRIASYVVDAADATTTSGTITTVDPVSIAAIAATGRDAFDSTVQNPDGTTEHVVGTMTAMGAAMDVHGWQLVPVLGSYVGDAPMHGYYLMDPAQGILFHTAFSRAAKPAASYPPALVPVGIAFPGDDGFLASTPSHGCGG